MIDQATELRKLVLRSMRERAAAAGPQPRLLVLAGGRGGVGVTTLAVNLAMGLADQGLRVVIVDADVCRNNVAVLCGISQRPHALDMLIARRDIHEAMQLGPSGIQVVPGLWAPGEKAESSPLVQERLLRQFRNLGPHADVVLVDVGSSPGEFTRRMAAVASDVLLITTPDVATIMDSYSRVKVLLKSLGKSTPWLIVNFCNDAAAANEVHHRMHESCVRFLGVGIRLLGCVPDDQEAQVAGETSLPFLVRSPGCAASMAVQRLAATLACETPDTSRHVA
jgi:flagellar biosynthesis protein FlhG